MDITDEQLIDQYNRGDTGALDKLVERYKRPLYSFLWRLTGSEAEADEIFQDTWLRVIQKANSFQQNRFRGWVFKIAHNLVIDRSRQKGRTVSLDVPAGNTEGDGTLGDLFEDERTRGADELAYHRDLRKDLEKALVQLPKEQSSVFVLRMTMDMTFREIAELQGITLNAALGRMQSALAKLRDLLKEHQPG